MGLMSYVRELFVPSIYKEADDDENKLLSQGNVIEVGNDETGDFVNVGFTTSAYNQVELLKDQASLINEYRIMALAPEVDSAIDDVVNAIVSCDEDEAPVSLNLEAVDDISEQTKKAILDSFNKILGLLNFNETAYEKTRQWYVDGQLSYQIVVDTKNEKKGIAKLILLDPRCIRKKVEYKTEVNAAGVEYVSKVDRYFIYDRTYLQDSAKRDSRAATKQNRNFVKAVGSAVKIPCSMIVQATSGMVSVDNSLILSELEKARRTLNNLRLTEDASVVNRLTRATQRLAFYVDVGNLPEKQADAKLRRAMQTYKNDMVFDSATGTVNGKNHVISMQQNYWFARSGSGKAAEVTTVDGASNADEIDDILMHRKNLYNSLNVPASRLDDGGSVNLLGSRAAEISRDEWKFSKFIARKRRKFSELFYGLLRYELVSTGVTTDEEWQELKSKLQFSYSSDSYQKEQAEAEAFQASIATLGDIEPYIGKYFSKETILRKVLGRDDQTIQAEKDRIQKEIDSGEIVLDGGEEV